MERAIDLLVEATLHGVVAALAVELLIRRLGVDDLAARARARLFVLVLPVLSVPLLHLFAPARCDDAAADYLLLSSERWNAFTLMGWPMRDALFSVFAAAGAALLARDAGRELVHTVVSRRGRQYLDHQPGWLAPVQAQCDAIARRAGVSPVPLRASGSHNAVLAARGFLRPVIVISRPVVDRLKPEWLEAALAHELSHVARRDVAKNAGLEVLRLLQWFNPIAQIVARRVAQEREWRADDDAVRWAVRPTALARALIESARGRGSDFLGLLGKARVAALEVRCHRLLDPRVPSPAVSPAETVVVGLALAAFAALVR